jgi:hypothetical protein
MDRLFRSHAALLTSSGGEAGIAFGGPLQANYSSVAYIFTHGSVLCPSIAERTIDTNNSFILLPREAICLTCAVAVLR